MFEQPLFAPAVVAISVSAVYTDAMGWRLIVAGRSAGEPFSDVHRHDYSHLSTAELMDTIESDIRARFALG